MNNKLPVAAIGHLVEVCHIHSANKQFFGIALARFKPSQPLMMSTSKCPKMKFGSIFAPNYIKATHDSAEPKVNYNELSKVT